VSKDLLINSGSGGAGDRGIRLLAGLTSDGEGWDGAASRSPATCVYADRWRFSFRFSVRMSRNRWFGCTPRIPAASV